MAGSDRAARVARALCATAQVIPAHPLALTAERAARRAPQRALTRYYVDAGAGGIAVGVHTTQFAIRDPSTGCYRPVLELAAETARASARPQRARRSCSSPASSATPPQAVARGGARRVARLRRRAARASARFATRATTALVAHCRAVAEVLPLFGFYLQPAVGGRVLGYRFWREFAEIERAWAIKIAPFDRYRTLDVVRAVADAGRDDLALYTGNDDSIVADLLTPFPVRSAADDSPRRIVGGLLGQWAVWTHARRAAARARARARDDRRRRRRAACATAPRSPTRTARSSTRPTRFAGCIPGIHEVLRRQGLLRGTWCLDPREELSPGQAEEIDAGAAGVPGADG